MYFINTFLFREEKDSCRMAGVPGFEPGMPVSKTGALTTWLYPIIIVTDFKRRTF